MLIIEATVGRIRPLIGPLFLVIVILLLVLFVGVLNAIGIDGEAALGFGQERRVVHLADTILAASLSEGQSRGGGVGDNVAADRNLLLAIQTRVGIGAHLIGDDDGQSIDISQSIEHPHESTQVLLAFGQIASAVEIGSIERSGTVHNEQGISASKRKEQINRYQKGPLQDGRTYLDSVNSSAASTSSFVW